MNRWEKILSSNDFVDAKKVVIAMNKITKRGEVIPWKDYAKIMEYPYTNMFVNGILTSHTRRVMVDIKLLSVFKKHTFPYKWKEK